MNTSWLTAVALVFFLFGPNTFTDREWGDGTENPAVFNPTSLDCEQWLRVAMETGFKLAILTAKHHDGFCLWPSAVTEHDIAASAWRDGKGQKNLWWIPQVTARTVRLVVDDAKACIAIAEFGLHFDPRAAGTTP